MCLHGGVCVGMDADTDLLTNYVHLGLEEITLERAASPG